MVDSIFSDNAFKSASMALDGLSARQQAISRNIANVDTPGYNAQTVDFESTIQHVLAGSGTGQLQMAATSSGHIGATQSSGEAFQTVNRPGGSARADQNNVDIDTELSQMSETGIQYQAVSLEVSKKLQLLKAIAQG
jgi:flagellar basal-body rod protein FlgB